MAETERTLIGAVEAFRAKPIEKHIPYEESREMIRGLRTQLHDLVRAHVNPPDVVETEYFDTHDGYPKVKLEATVSSLQGAIEVVITADAYPLRLTEEEQKITDERRRQAIVDSRLGGIKYGIRVEDMDHRVVVGGWEPHVISILPGYEASETQHYPDTLASIDEGATVGSRSFTRGDYRLYGGLLERLSSDPSVTFEGHARDINKYVHVEHSMHYARRPAEMGLPQTSA